MNFLNSKEWRKFQESVGRKTFDLGNGFMVKMGMPFSKNYLYSNYPNAPEYIDEIKKIAKKENAIFFRFEPLVTDYGLRITDYGFRKSAKALQPQRTIVLDLKQNYDNLLKKMHTKTRYNIKLAERHKIDVKESGDIETFWKLLQKTTERDKFSSHPKNYYKKLLELNDIRLFVAYYKKQPAATAIVIFYNKTATYLHGASDYSLRKYMAPHALHREIITIAKKENMEEYDFWGIDEKRWPGVTRFKRGFLSAEALAKEDGGREVEYVGSWDLPIQTFWYKLYSIKNSR